MPDATENQIRAEKVIERIYNDPEFAGLAPKVHEVVKTMFDNVRDPPAVTLRKTVEPEVTAVRDELKQTKDQLAKALERLDKRDEREAEEKTFREMQSAVDAAVGKFNLTEEGKAAMLDRMKETRNYTDVEAAAAYIAHSAPPQSSSGPSWAPRKANFYGTAEADESFARLHKDPGGFLDDELQRFAKDPSKYAAEAA